MHKYLIATTIFVHCLVATPARGDLTKQDAFEIMKKNGFRWKQIETIKLDAESKSGEAQSGLSPHFNFYSRQYIGRINQIQYGFADAGALTWFTVGVTGVEFGYELIDRAAVERVKAAHENESLGAATTSQYRDDLTYLMLIQYLNVQRLQKSLNVLNLTLERDQKIFELAKRKVKVGAGVSLDLKRAEGLIEKDKYKQIDATTNLFKACKELGSTLGQPNLQCDLEELKFKTAFEETNLKSADLLSRRADVTAAHYAVEVASRLRDVADKESLPKLALYGEAGYGGSAIYGGTSAAVSGIFGIQLTFPLYDGDYNKNLVQAENVKVIQASLQEKQLALDAENQVEVSLAQLRDAKVAIQAANRNNTLAHEELSLSQRKFSYGASNGLDLSNAQLNVVNAEDMNTQAIFAYEVAKLNYFKANGKIEDYFQSEARR